MSRGIGRTQSRALAAIEKTPGLTVRELAARLGRSERFARTVVSTLDERRLVIVRNEEGEPLAPRQRQFVYLPEQLRAVAARRDAPESSLGTGSLIDPT